MPFRDLYLPQASAPLAPSKDTTPALRAELAIAHHTLPAAARAHAVRVHLPSSDVVMQVPGVGTAVRTLILALALLPPLGHAQAPAGADPAAPAAMLALPAVAAAQSAGSSGMGAYTAGYGGARYSTARPQTGSTRDTNGNRLIVNGIIQTGASAYSSTSGGVGASGSASGNGQTIGGSTAIGNSLNVVVQGNHNTVIVNSTQVNNGNVTAGTTVNGTPRAQ